MIEGTTESGRDEALGEVLGEGWISRGEFLDDGTSVGADQREVFPVLAEAEVGVQFGARDGVVLVGGKYYEITARRVGGTSPDTGCRNAPASTSRSTELSREPGSVPPSAKPWKRVTVGVDEPGSVTTPFRVAELAPTPVA